MVIVQRCSQDGKVGHVVYADTEEISGCPRTHGGTTVPSDDVSVAACRERTGSSEELYLIVMARLL